MNDQAKVTVITGGVGGMGLAIARRFADKGPLMLADIAAGRLAGTREQYQA